MTRHAALTSVKTIIHSKIRIAPPIFYGSRAKTRKTPRQLNDTMIWLIGGCTDAFPTCCRGSTFIEKRLTYSAFISIRNSSDPFPPTCSIRDD
ncbi:hypothetical protein BV898_09122 [Hypsibius exemplaris]|uniref:Uncharacterized protein n=1 Tax=Hypsibius exemplaris TaxID=2072580 RepID=A0A1W0WNJ5_HYPEX|nr:hypothetical protein BV898_09122 [Hypsibius exemplaris]